MRRRVERYAVLLLLAIWPFWLSSLDDSLKGQWRLEFLSLFKPAFRVVESFQMGLTELVSGVVQGPFLIAQNRLLRERLVSFQAHEETHRQLSQENQRLREFLGFKQKTPWRLLPAEVIGHEFTLWSRTLLLDKGRRNGVAAGMAVITPAGLAGRVLEVGREVSRVILITDPHFRVSAVVASSRHLGLVTGSASGECWLTYLPKEVNLEEGEPILTAGGVSFCPEGIPIGKVQRMKEDPSKLFQSARLEPAVSLSSVEEVLIVTAPTGSRE